MLRLRHRIALVPALVAVLSIGTACAGTVRAEPRASSPGAPAPAATAPLPSTSAFSAPVTSTSVARRVSKLLVVVLENRSEQEALGQMPRLAAQAHHYGVATNWYAVAHPSLPNYLELVAGSTYGVRDDDPPSAHHLHGTSVFGQLTSHGRSAVTYAQRIPSPCYQQDAGRYAVRHNPATYFVDARERAACRADNLPLGSLTRGPLHTAVTQGRLPTYALLIPDVCNDGHDCSLAQVDPWLDTWLRLIESGPDFRSGRLAVVVTFDEDDHSAGNHVLTVVAAAQLHRKVVTRRFTHASLAAAPSRLAGLPPLRNGKGTPDVLRAFGLR